MSLKSRTALVEKVHAKLYPSQLTKLNRYCEQHNKSRSEVLRALVDTLEAPQMSIRKVNYELPVTSRQLHNTASRTAKIARGDYRS